MLIVSPLIVGFVLGIIYVSSRGHRKGKDAATFIGCLGALVLAIVTSIGGSVIWDLWHWLNGTPNYAFLKEWIYLLAFVILGFGGLGWLIGGIVARFFKTQP
jgi:uncharacterized membrane protein YeiH